MNEAEVYISAKLTLTQLGWVLLAGQPPNGTDNLPVIEIRDGEHRMGSKGSLKPDLVAYNGGVVLIVEAKPLFDKDDEWKLLAALSSGVRLLALVSALRERKLLERHEVMIDDEDLTFAGALAHSGRAFETSLAVISAVPEPRIGSMSAPSSVFRLSGAAVALQLSVTPWS